MFCGEGLYGLVGMTAIDMQALTKTHRQQLLTRKHHIPNAMTKLNPSVFKLG
jgi:hypothetical protein